MSYSQEEIEKKRLLALQRKQQSQVKNNLSNAGRTQSSTPSTSVINNENKSFNTNKLFQHGGNKFSQFKSKFQNNSFNNNTKFNKQKERFNPLETKNFFGQKARITGKCYMISDDRFMLETSTYFPPVIEVYKTIPSKCYDMKTKAWSFNIKDYEDLMKKLITFKSDIQIAGLPKKVLQVFRKNNNSDRSVENVTPSSVRYQWAEAISTFLPSVPTHYVHNFINTHDFVGDKKIVITSYDLLVRALERFERHTFGFVILDESHTLKSAKTARYKAAQRITSKVGHVVLLSGTPALSRPIELYSQLNLIMPNFMGYQEYGNRYCAGEKTAYGWDFKGSSNMQELQLFLKHTCIIRRLKNEVMKVLPSKKREVIVLDPDLIKAGTKEMEEMSKALERTTLNGIERHAALLQYYNESSIAKQKAICDYVAKLFKNKQKCLIFAHHQNILDAVCEVAESMDIKYIRIDGKTNPERRKYQVDKFQSCDNYLAAVLSITAANAGITLTAAQLVVFAELFWNPGIICQAEDRVHRIGQNDDVLIQYLVAKQTADDYLWPLIQKKMNVLNEVGLDHNFSLTDISITKHSLDSKQKTLDYFRDNVKSQCTTDEETTQKTENNNSSSNSSKEDIAAEEEKKDLLELSAEDFNFCDWDDWE
nr:SWI/SNF-related matrix-associated actin-dependent regulator of chromatin subfamily A-like protein 1 [Nomia melanderi]